VRFTAGNVTPEGGFTIPQFIDVEDKKKKVKWLTLLLLNLQKWKLYILKKRYRARRVFYRGP
jgi:hypothetical protein